MILPSRLTVQVWARVKFAFVIAASLLLIAVDSAAPADDLSFFTEANCLDCHAGDSAEAGLDLESLSFDVPDTANRDTWVKIYDRVERGEMPPEDYEHPDASAKHAFLERTKEQILSAENDRRNREGRTVFRRLNRVEYENTLRDSLGVPHLEVRDLLPPDQSSHGFDNQAAALELSFVHIARYLKAAEFALDEAMRYGPLPETKKWSVEASDLLQIKKGIEIGDARGVLRQTNSAQTPYAVSRVKPHADGVYKIKVDAFGFHWNHGKVEPARDEQVLSVYASPRKSVSRLLHSQSISGNPNDHQPVEFDAYVRAGEKIILYFSTLTTANRPRKIPLDTVDAPGVAIGNVTVQGPIPDAHDGHQTNSRLEIDANLSPKRIHELLASFMNRMCRHPVDAAIVERHAKLVQRELDNGAPPEKAMRAGYQSILCSPSFLFFHERRRTAQRRSACYETELLPLEIAAGRGSLSPQGAAAICRLPRELLVMLIVC